MNILVTGARAPIASDLAQAFALSGHHVWVADNLRFPLAAASPHIRGLIYLPPPRTGFPSFVRHLRAACATYAINAIVPTSEEVFWLAGAAPFLPPSVAVRTSPLQVLAELHHKGTFSALASHLGHGAPENHLLSSPADLERLPDPARFVFKPVYSRFATQTLIAPTARALSRVRPTPVHPWLAQTYLHGRELCAYNVASAGRLLLHVAYEPRFRYGTGASTYFLPVVHAGLRGLCADFIAATAFTGQISFDVIETADRLVAIECNPRGTSGVHLAAQQPAALASCLLGETNSTTPHFAAQARQLRLPLLLNHPGAPFRSVQRALLHAAPDSLRFAGIPVFAQTAALAELAWHALRRGVSFSRASTADFEWNGEPIHD